jgi:hypothetical protein
MTAHIAGVPLEEMLPALGGIGTMLVAARVDEVGAEDPVAARAWVAWRLRGERD